jgi:hypothetical protein
MSSDSDPAIPREQESFTVDYFRPEDAEGIVRLFRSVYGEHYPIRLFYDPAEIVQANRDGRYYSIVARTPSGEIIGVNHLYPSAPCRSLYESGVGLVRKDYRSLGVNSRTLGYLYNDFIPRHPHIEEIFGEAVCNHPYMQKAIGPYGFVETAIEVALMPAETYAKEKSAAGRVATLGAFRCYRPKSHRIFLPAAYDAALRRIYGRLDDARELEPSVEKIPAGAASRAEMTVFDFARVARIAVPAIGDDFRARLAELEAQGREKKAVVFQVWVDLTTPWVGAAVEALRESGYFFGGALPRWFGGDGMLMQKLRCPPDFEGIVLESAFSKELLGVIQADWRRAESIKD